MEPDPRRERYNPSGPEVERQWSPYDEMAANEEAEFRRGRRRRWLLGLGAIALVMCVVLGVAGYILFGRATEPDRSTPVAVVYQYVDFIFSSRDIERAKQFECEGTNPSEPLLEVLSQVEERERQFDVVFVVKVVDYKTEELGATATVSANIDFFAPVDAGKLSQSRQAWQFELKDEDGWRVCGASKREP